MDMFPCTLKTFQSGLGLANNEVQDSKMLTHCSTEVTLCIIFHLICVFPPKFKIFCYLHQCLCICYACLYSCTAYNRSDIMVSHLSADEFE